MDLGDLFKSKRERERDKAKARRRAFRTAERSIEAVEERIRKLTAERDAAWREARGYLKDGQRAMAQRSLQSVRAGEILVAKLNMKRWVFKQIICKLELAKTDEDFVGALGAIDAVVSIDPERVDDVLTEIDLKLADQADIDKTWEREFRREMEGAEAQMSDTVPSLDELEKQLEDEVAAEVGEGRTAEKAAPDADLAEGIGEARDRLRKVLDEGDDG
jgi:hypothetical protein